MANKTKDERIDELAAWALAQAGGTQPQAQTAQPAQQTQPATEIATSPSAPRNDTVQEPVVQQPNVEDIIAQVEAERRKRTVEKPSASLPGTVERQTDTATGESWKGDQARDREPKTSEAAQGKEAAREETATDRGTGTSSVEDIAKYYTLSSGAMHPGSSTNAHTVSPQKNMEAYLESPRGIAETGTPDSIKDKQRGAQERAAAARSEWENARAETNEFRRRDIQYDDPAFTAAREREEAAKQRMDAATESAGRYGQAGEYRDAMEKAAERYQIETAAKENPNYEAWSRKTPENIPNQWRYDNLTSEEKAVYNFLAESDRQSGVENRAGYYMNTLEKELEDRAYRQRTTERYGTADDPWYEQVFHGVAKFLDEMAEGTTRALVGITSGKNDPWLQQQIKNDATTPDYSAENYNNSMLWRALSGAGRSIGQMIPSMMAGNMVGAAAAPFSGALSAGTSGALTAEKVGRYAANAAFYGTIKPSATIEAKTKYGMDDAQAEAYGTMVAATEVGLQSVLGGIAAYGGLSEGAMAARIAKIDNALLQTLAYGGWNLVGEETEELLQDGLEPLYVSLLTGNEYEAPTFEQLLETALSTAMMIGATGMTDNLNYYQEAKYNVGARHAIDMLNRQAANLEAIGANDVAAAALAMANSIQYGGAISEEALAQFVEKADEAYHTVHQTRNAYSASAEAMAQFVEKADEAYHTVHQTRNAYSASAEAMAQNTANRANVAGIMEQAATPGTPEFWELYGEARGEYNRELAKEQEIKQRIQNAEPGSAEYWAAVTEAKNLWEENEARKNNQGEFGGIGEYARRKAEADAAAQQTGADRIADYAAAQQGQEIAASPLAPRNDTMGEIATTATQPRNDMTGGVEARGVSPQQFGTTEAAQPGTGRQSEAVGTIASSPAIPAEFTQRVLKERQDAGEWSYVPDTNQAQLERGQAWVNERDNSGKSLAEIADEWVHGIASAGISKNTKVLQAAGYSLLSRLANETANSSHTEAEIKALDQAALRVFTGLQKAASSEGQLLQMQKILQQMTPEMQIYAVKEVAQQLSEQLKGKGYSIVVNEGLASNLTEALKSGDADKIQAAREALYDDIVKQMPTNARDKLNAWRYLSMLGNPTTILRNFLGNTGFMPLKYVSGKMQAAVQSYLEKTGRIAQDERTKYGGVLSATENGRALLKWGGEVAKTMTEDLKGEGKYYNGGRQTASEIERAYHEYQSQFQNKALRKAQEAVDWALNSEAIGDARFLNHHAKVELANIAAARGYSISENGVLVDKNGNAVSDATINQMKALAAEEAKKATYRDTNAATEFFKKMRSSASTPGAQVRNTLVDAVFPFIATPTNIIVRSIEYSPVGLLKTVALETGKLNKTLKSETASAAEKSAAATEYVGNLCDGLTGSLIVGLGICLASQGLLTGGILTDDDEREGKQKYSINIGDTHISIDWLAPEAAILLAGATLWESFDKKEYPNALDAIYGMLGDYLGPIVEMSMLSGVQDFLESTRYVPGKENVMSNLMYALTIGAFMNYASQYIPTLWSKGMATARDKDTQTYTGDIPSGIGRQFTRSAANIGKKAGVDVIGNAIGKLTGGNENMGSEFLRQQPKLDEWGRETEVGNAGQRAAQNFANLAKVTTSRVTDADREIDRVQAETGRKDLAPEALDATVSVRYRDEYGDIRSKDVKLTGDQYTQYQQTFGQLYNEYIGQLMDSAVYQNAPAKEQAEMLEKAKTLAKEMAKTGLDIAGFDGGDDELVDWKDSAIAKLVKDGLSFADAWNVREFDNEVNGSGSGAVWGYAASLPGADAHTPTAVTDEIVDVMQQTGTEQFFTTGNPQTVNGTKLTDEQKEQYQTARGAAFNEQAEALLADKAYQNASAEDRLGMLEDAWELAGEQAKQELGLGYESDSKVLSLVSAGVPLSAAYAAAEKHKALDEQGKDETGESAAAATQAAPALDFAAILSGNASVEDIISWATSGAAGTGNPSATGKLKMNEKAAEFKAWVQSQNWDAKTKQAVLDKYGTFTSMNFSDTDKYDQLTGNGISGSAAVALIEAIGDLKPLEGKSSVSPAQKWDAIAKSNLTENQKIAAMYSYMTDAQIAKLETFLNSGLTVQDYVNVYTAKATQGSKSGNWTKATLKAYLDKSSYTAAQKYWIWEVFGTTKYNQYPKAAAADWQRPNSASAGEQADDVESWAAQYYGG